MRSDSRRYRRAPWVIMFGKVWLGGGETLAVVINSRVRRAHMHRSCVISKAKSSVCEQWEECHLLH